MTTDIGHVGSLFGLDEIDEVSGAVRVALLDPGPVVEGRGRKCPGRSCGGVAEPVTCRADVLRALPELLNAAPHATNQRRGV
jgi:hypothetical protein